MTHPETGNASTESPKSFEQTLQRLEALVAEMEKGELGLDEMLKRFEEGMKLAETCEKRLGETRKRVEILMKKNEQSEPQWQEVQPPEPPSSSPGDEG